MTNLEWIRTLSEEEFADWLYDEWLHHLQYRWSSSRGGLIIWLKDRKTENSSEKPNNCEDLQDWKDRMWTEAMRTCGFNVDGYRQGQPTDEPQTVRSNLEPFRVDEPQTEMTTEQIVNELLFIKKILDDGKMPKQTHDIRTNTHECVRNNLAHGYSVFNADICHFETEPQKERSK